MKMDAIRLDPAAERACRELFNLAHMITFVVGAACGRRRRLGYAAAEVSSAMFKELARALKRAREVRADARDALAVRPGLTAEALGLSERHAPILALIQSRLGRAEWHEAAAYAALLAYRALAAGALSEDSEAVGIALCAAAMKRLRECGRCREVVLRTRDADYSSLEEWARDVGVPADALRPAWRLARRLYGTSDAGLRTALLQLLIERRISL